MAAAILIASQTPKTYIYIYIYIPGFEGILKKKFKKKLVASWRPFWLSVESWNSNQVISILMGNVT